MVRLDTTSFSARKTLQITPRTAHYAVSGNSDYVEMLLFDFMGIHH